MPRPTDIAQKATAESRRNGALAANAKRRELSLTLGERTARALERRAEAFVDALIASAALNDDDGVAREKLHDAVAEMVSAIHRSWRLDGDRLTSIPLEAVSELHSSAVGQAVSEVDLALPPPFPAGCP